MTERNLAAARRQPRHRRRAATGSRPTGRGDAGITLIELVVAMGLMGVFLAIFTAAIVDVYGTVNRTQAISEAQTQVNLAMTRLDQEIRYAAEISKPAASGDPTVEYLTTHTGVAVCSQVRLDVDRQSLQRRAWQQGGTPPRWDTVPPLVGHIAAAEFTLPVEDGVQLNRLTVRLTAASGSGRTAAEKETVVTFTAQNSTAADESEVCAEGRGHP